MRFLLSCSLLGLITACADLPSIPAQGCGNLLVEPQLEDCDEPRTAGGARCARPGEPHACRYVCVDAGNQSFPCPAGYACGSDGVCRTPSKSYQQVGRSIETSAESLAIGDFDDNRQAEVVTLSKADIFGRSSAQVIFFSRDAENAEVSTIPGFLGTPAVGRFTNSPYDGLAFESFPGVATLIGRRDRQFFPRSYPSLSIPPEVTDLRAFALDVIPTRTDGSLNAYGSEVVLLLETAGQQAILVQPIGNVGNGEPIVLGLLPAPFNALNGDLLAPRLNKKDDAYCSPIVISYKLFPALYLIEPCTGTTRDTLQWNPAPLVRQIPLPAEHVAVSPPLAVDANGDGHLDLMMGVARKEKPGLFMAIAYGDGNGGLSPELGSKATGFSIYKTELQGDSTGVCVHGKISEDDQSPPQSLSLMLAAGELNGDKDVDFVSIFGLCVSRQPEELGGAPQYTRVTGPLANIWVEALLVDLNGDGLQDVVGVPYQSNSLDLMLATSGGLYNPSSIPLNGTPSLLQRGDFDGDGIDDVAFRERGVQSTSNVGVETGDALTVLFGSAAQPGTQIIREGRFVQIEQLTRGSLENALGVQDAIDDLGLVSRATTAVGTTPDVSLLNGSADRAIRSPFFLANTPEATPQIPLQTAAGRFSRHTSDTQQDILILGRGFTGEGSPGDHCPGVENAPVSSSHLFLWLALLRDDAQLSGLISSSELQLNSPPELDLGCQQLAALGAGDLDGDGLDEALLALNTKSGGSLQIARVQGESTSLALDPALALPYRISPLQRPFAHDVDGDGQVDIVLTIEQGTTTGLAVLWGQAGGFDTSAPVITLPEQSVRGACVVRGAPRSEVLLLGTSSLARLATDRSLAVSTVDQVTAEAKGGLALVCGDIDADGVDDVAISSGSLLRVFRGTPVRP